MIKIWNYGKKTEYHGYKLDSIKELSFYQRFLEKYDNDSNSKFVIKAHPSYQIIDGFEIEPGLKFRGAKYTPDFTVEDHQGHLLHVYDVKNSFTAYGISDAAKLRFKLFEKRYGVPVECVVALKNSFKIKIFGTTKKTKINTFKDINYDWREVL